MSHATLVDELPRHLRPVADADSDALIALVGAAYAEYPGCVLDLPGVDADLTAPATTAARHGTTQWVLEDAGQVVACIGIGALDGDQVELKRLYVAATHRRRGLAAALVGHVEAEARRSGAARLELWTDRRFRDAHRLYERRGFEVTGETRHLGDPSDTTELRYVKVL